MRPTENVDILVVSSTSTLGPGVTSNIKKRPTGETTHYLSIHVTRDSLSIIQRSIYKCYLPTSDGSVSSIKMLVLEVHQTCQKRPTKETYKRNLQTINQPLHQLSTADGSVSSINTLGSYAYQTIQKRPTKETYRRDLQRV